MSKLLLAVETGNLTDFSGKKFNELDDIPDLAEEEENDSDVGMPENEAETGDTEEEDRDDSEVSSVVVNRKSGGGASNKCEKLKVKNRKTSSNVSVPQYEENKSNEAEMSDTEQEDVNEVSSVIVKRKTGGAASNMCKKFKEKNCKTSAKVAIKRPWASTEKEAVYKFLSEYIKKGTVSGKTACLQAIEKSSGVLAGRCWMHVKFAVKNILASHSRMLKE